MGRKETAMVIALAANGLLVGLKLALATLSGSLAVRASAWHSVADGVVSLIVLVGVVLARRDRKGADGASRVEYAVALLVGLFLLFMAYDIFREVAGGEDHMLEKVLPVALASLLGVALSYFMGHYKLYVGRATGSPGLIADGQHSMMEMWSSLVVVAGLFGYLVGFRSLDKVAAVVVVLFIVSAAYEILSDAWAGLRGGPQLPRLGHLHRLSGRVVGGLVAALALFYVLSGLTAINVGEVGLLTRFGQPRLVLGPGLTYRLPWPFERIDRVRIDEVRRTPIKADLMLTGDENLLSVSAVAHYQVADPVAFRFGLGDPTTTAAAATQAAVRQTVGERRIDELLTDGRAAAEVRGAELLQARLDQAGAGLRVLAVKLESITPPNEVADAFRDVASAREDRAAYVNEARAYANEVLPKARGEAARMLQTAEAYKAERIARAQGDADRFRSKLASYLGSEGVTRTRLYLEAAERVLPKARKFLISPELQGESVELWFAGASPLQFPPVGGLTGPPAPAPAPPATTTPRSGR